MQRDVHFDSDSHAQAVRLTASSGPASDHIEIDDARFLFTAHFKKSGPDLILTGDDGRKLVVVDYFNTAKHPDLTSHGATLSGDLVAHLAGPDAPGHYAQAGAPAGAQVIGKCERMGGGATVQHANGVVEDIHAGDAILKGDIVMTNDGSSLVLSLSDGTVFNMGASARMVLNELVYDANSTSNSALISLVKGSFTFVAGQVAHTGDMKVDTPVATMGIRGTTVNTNIDADINGNVFSVTYSLMTDPNGNVGGFQVLDRVTGVVIASVTSTGSVLNVTPAANFQVLAQETAKSPAEVQQELNAAQILFPIYQAVQTQVTQPPAPPQGPQGPQQQQQQNTSPPGGSLQTKDQSPQPSQETGSGNGGNANPDKIVIHDITIQTSGAPQPNSTPTQPQQTQFIPTTPTPTTTTPTIPTVAHVPPTIEVVGTPADLVEPFGGNGTLPTASVGFAIGGDGTVQYDANALASDGWTTSDGFTFIKQFPYGTAVLDPPPNDPSAGHLAFILDPTNPAVRALRVGHQISIPPITIPVIDSQGDKAQTTVTFTIDGTNHPVAQNSAAEGQENATSISGQAQASEFGFTLTYALVGPHGEAEQTVKTVHGTVTMHSDGSYVYTPDHGYFGPDSFAFQANDGELTTAATTVTVTVDPVAPIAQDDALSGAEDSGPVNGQAHATEINNDLLTYALVGSDGEAEHTLKTAHGTVTMQSNGSYSYTPDHGFFGTDSFTYTASDGINGTTSDPATITVDVAAAPPVAQDGTVSGTEDSEAITGQAHAIEINDDQLSYALVGSDGEAEHTLKTAHGTVTMQSNGSYSYTPDHGFFGTDSFTYQTTDTVNHTVSNSATVTVSVAPVAPVAQNGTASGNEDGSAITGQAMATDVNTSDPLSYSLVGSGGGAEHGSVVMHADGTFTYTPDAGYVGSDSFTYTASDATNGTVSNTATETVTVAAAAPVAQDGSAGGNEDDNAISGQAVASQINGDPLTYILAGSGGGAEHGSVVMHADGTFTYTPDTGYVGPDSFTYTASDATNGTVSNTATETVTVAAVAPVAQDGSAGGNEDDNAISGQAVASQINGDPLSYTLTGSGGGAAHGSVVMHADGTFTYTPDAGYVGSDSFTYTASDATNGTVSNTATETVTVAAAAPVARDGSAGGNEDDNAISGQAVASQINGDPLSYTLTGSGGGAEHGSVVMHADGTLLNSTGLSDARPIDVAVTGIDDPPTIGGDLAFTLSKGSAVVLTTVDLRAVDPDDTAGNLTFTASEVTNGHLALVNAPATPITSFTEVQLEAGQVMFVHDGSATTSAGFSVSVKDAGGLTSATATVNATVSQVEPGLWGDLKFPNVTPSQHVFTPSVQFNSVGGFLAIAFSTAFNYDPVGDPSGPYVRGEYAALTDPFLLPDHQAPQSLGQDTETLPARSNLIVPNIGGTSPEGIRVSVTQANGDGTGPDVINRVVLTEASNGALMSSAPTVIGSQATTGATIFNLNESFRTTNSSPSAPLQNYDVAWDQYNSTTHTYQVYFQTFNPDNSALAASPVLTTINLSNVQLDGSAEPILPAWQLKLGFGGYVLAAATPTQTVNTNLGLTGQTYDAIHFQGYDTNGTLDNNVANFFIRPDVSAHPGAVTHITQELIPSIGEFPGQTVQALQFAMISSTNLNGFGVAWNETVTYTDAQGTHGYDQIEFDVDKVGSGVFFHQVIAIPDGDPQNIRLGQFSDSSGKDYFVLAYGDDTGTHIQEYNVATINGTTTVTQVASLFDPSTQAFANMTLLGDGRVELTYDDKLAADQTSQLDLKVFDLRNAGITFNGQTTNATGHDNYIAGTQFSDTVTGEHGHNNTYYYVGADLPNSGSTPVDTFNGHDNSGWNTAILPDAHDNYTITTNNNGSTLTNVGDPAHAGSLVIDQFVEALAFAPTEDPTPANNGGIVHASGDELLILSNVNNQSFAIDGTATLEFTGSVNNNSLVTFDATGATLKLDQPSQFNAVVNSFDGNSIDFVGVSSNDTAKITAYDPAHSQETLSLLGADNHVDAQVTLLAESSSQFFVTDDGHGNALVSPDQPLTTSFENIVTDASLLNSGNGLSVSGDLLTQFDADPNEFVFANNPTISAVDGSQTLGQVGGSSGNVTYTAPSGFTPPAVGQTFADQFTYTLRDTAGLSATGHVGVLAESGTQIVGTTGHDVIQGASGDTLTGLGGGDVFVFNFNAGNQTISDFHQGQDLVDVSAFGFSQQQVQQIIDATTPGDHTLALAPNETITFAGVDVHQLNASQNFILSHHTGA